MSEKEERLNYNFVFFFARYDYYRSIFGKEVFENDHVHVYKETFNGPKWMQLVFHYHWAYTLNRRIQMPFKRIWFMRMYRQSFKNDLPLCFIYCNGSNVFYDGGFTDYVRNMDSRNRQVVYYDDLISKDCDFETIRSKADLVISYDQSEAIKYDICYFKEDTYSKLIDLPEEFDYESDVYFLGAAKDRLKLIMETYKALSKQGLKCKFILAGVDEKDRIKAEGIEYTNGISYEENLRHVVKTKCLLEIVQGGSVDMTLRSREAIAYQRRLLTNCVCIPKEYYHKSQLQVFSKPDAINTEFIRRDFDPKEYPPLYDMNPMRRLYFIQEQLEKSANE